jgi:hypothetical protein
MLSRVVMVAIIAGLVSLSYCVSARAGETKVIVGIVKAAAADAEEAATVKVGQTVYKIVKDDNGKTVAKDAKEKKCEIKGNVEDKDGAKWITVIGCKIVE